MITSTSRCPMTSDGGKIVLDISATSKHLAGFVEQMHACGDLTVTACRRFTRCHHIAEVLQRTYDNAYKT